jgi:hypothetical protein
VERGRRGRQPRAAAEVRERGLGGTGQLLPGVLAVRQLRVRLPGSSGEAGAGAGDSEKWQGGGTVWKEWRES